MEGAARHWWKAETKYGTNVAFKLCARIWDLGNGPELYRKQTRTIPDLAGPGTKAEVGHNRKRVGGFSHFSSQIEYHYDCSEF